MGRNLRHLVLRHVDSIMKFPDSQLAQSLPELFSRKFLTLSQFDNMITVHAGGTSPPLPFKNVHHYYTHAASHRVLGDVSIPFLGINLDDDPMEKNVPMYETDNERVVLVVTCGGGHLGWLGTDVTVLGGCPSCPPPDIQTKSRAPFAGSPRSLSPSKREKARDRGFSYPNPHPLLKRERVGVLFSLMPPKPPPPLPQMQVERFVSPPSRIQ